ncbi:ecto-ADP-ribosyltransferase 5-like [Discoglossus pictus]
MASAVGIYLILCVFLRHIKAQKAAETVILSPNPEIFDDQYIGCQKETEEKFISNNVLEQEMNINDHFKYEWQGATQSWKEKKTYLASILPPEFKDNHGIAVVAYTGSIYSEFNAACRSVGRSRDKYINNFHFKALHYYLTMALKLLSTPCKSNGDQVFRGVYNIHFKPLSNSSYIRFGQFTSTSVNKQTSESFGTGSFFTLTTCFGIPIGEFSFFPFEGEVLVPGNEMFKVTDFDENSHMFILTSTKRTCSYTNCVYIGGNSTQDPSALSSDDTSVEARLTEKYCVYNSASSPVLVAKQHNKQVFPHCRNYGI